MSQLTQALYDDKPEAWAQLEALERRDWAVRVLDAWTAIPGNENYPFMTQPSEGMGPEDAFCCWTRVAPQRQQYFYGTTFDTARLVAAEAVWPELPESVRAEIGERP